MSVVTPAPPSETLPDDPVGTELPEREQNIQQEVAEFINRQVLERDAEFFDG